MKPLRIIRALWIAFVAMRQGQIHALPCGDCVGSGCLNGYIDDTCPTCKGYGMRVVLP